MSKLPIVSIIGRPNVGKSTLFNRILHKRHSIVDQKEGITRDRIYEKVEWNSQVFNLVDTGGYIPNESNVIDTAIREQINLALQESSLVLFLVDGRDGLLPSDKTLADIIRQSGKKTVLVINKIDSNDMEALSSDFLSLGFTKFTSISGLAGRKIGDLLDTVVSNLNFIKKIKEDENEIRVAIVGCPNAGKSSILNRLIGEKKSIVTNIPGTTRDAIDSEIKFFEKKFILIDTAGLRRKSKIKENIEFYSTVRTRRALENSNIGIVVIDAELGFIKQDNQIVEEVMRLGKGLIILVNKWDLIEKETNTMKTFKNNMIYKFPTIQNFPILFVSAKTNQRISNIMKESLNVYDVWKTEFSTSKLNKVLKESVSRYSPPSVRGKNIKIKYATQTGTKPPKIRIFCNFPHLVPMSYKNYLENQFRISLELFGTPVFIKYSKS